MLYRIIRKDGTPTADLNGNVIEFPTRREPVRWAMPVERVVPVNRPE